jgi:hypothetical protein
MDLMFANYNFVWISYISCLSCMLHVIPTHPPWFDCHSNIWWNVQIWIWSSCNISILLLIPLLWIQIFWIVFLNTVIPCLRCSRETMPEALYRFLKWKQPIKEWNNFTLSEYIWLVYNEMCKAHQMLCLWQLVMPLHTCYSCRLVCAKWCHL